MNVAIGLLHNSPCCKQNDPMINGLQILNTKTPSDFGAQMFFQASRHKGFEEGSEEIPVH
jgi:hypothetical protein